MSRSVIVLGTLHRLQGAENAFGNIDDPLYPILVRGLIEANSIEFVFEEGTGVGPTAAERLAGEVLGHGRYLDVDPPREQREGLGIPSGSNEPYFFGNPPDCDFANWQLIPTHEGREKLWLQRIEATSFRIALMICGNAHMLSFAFRLRQAGFETRAIDYLPIRRFAGLF